MSYSKKIEQLLNGGGGNYILPFLWLHGEEHEVLKEELDYIRKCGIREICIESRPHPDFLGEQWWSDLDMIMEEARKHNMRVWVLDDKKFPTGYANGAFQNKYPEQAKLYLAQRHMDVVGPCKESAVLIEPFLGKDGKLLAVLACPKPDRDTLDILGEGIINLTDKVHDGVVYFDIPEGFYRIFVLFTTRQNGGRDHYMNLIDNASVEVLLKEVYEPHYTHYGKEFGKHFAGFFSDEPELGNVKGYDFKESLGKRDVKLPWSEELESLLRATWHEEFIYRLPGLWYEMGEKTPFIRYTYMDSVSKLVERCFSQQVGEWCKAHNVSYIGHIIEDDNAHARLGCSIGHYFRAQKGQDMSGIDVVHLQIMPGFTEGIHQWIASDKDGEFFHYGLAKLGSSLAHIDPTKKGKALCEIFGSYGWGEGIGLMKWLTDHMLVRGINTFVPHAFSPIFPDRDCPPHFYARGNNPQYEYFKVLMEYMNRLSHLLNDGIYRVDTAVLYHGEAEWCGGETMLFQKPVRALLEHQLDCDVIPAESLEESKSSINAKGELVINGVSYPSLVIPYCEYIPDQVVAFIKKAIPKGVKVYMLDKLPVYTCSGKKVPSAFEQQVTCIPLECLADTLKQVQGASIKLDKTYKDLRFSCYQHADSKVLMFFNESIHETVQSDVIYSGEDGGQLIEYDAVMNKCQVIECHNQSWRLNLVPGESKVYIMQQRQQGISHHIELVEKEPIKLMCDWTVSSCKADAYPKFEKQLLISKDKEFPNMNGPSMFPRFTGIFRYEGTITLTIEVIKTKKVLLEVPHVTNGAKVLINTSKPKMIIGAPYTVDVTGLLQEGENQVVIEVPNTLVWQVHDGQSTHMQLGPTGLRENPILRVYDALST